MATTGQDTGTKETTMKVKEREALTKAIRSITVDAPNGTHNNESERQLLALVKIMNPAEWGVLPEPAVRQYQKVCYALAALTRAIGTEAMSLRLAAQDYFDEDFQRPADPVMPPLCPAYHAAPIGDAARDHGLTECDEVAHPAGEGMLVCDAGHVFAGTTEELELARAAEPTS
jgi:hypothetical protein